jgi:hypothetical protein
MLFHLIKATSQFPSEWMFSAVVGQRNLVVQCHRLGWLNYALSLTSRGHIYSNSLLLITHLGASEEQSGLCPVFCQLFRTLRACFSAERQGKEIVCREMGRTGNRWSWPVSRQLSVIRLKKWSKPTTILNHTALAKSLSGMKGSPYWYVSVTVRDNTYCITDTV